MITDKKKNTEAWCVPQYWH